MCAMKRFSDLNEAEILALAISNEEEDARIYLQFANRLRADFPGWQITRSLDDILRELASPA